MHGTILLYGNSKQMVRLYLHPYKPTPPVSLWSSSDQWMATCMLSTMGLYPPKVPPLWYGSIRQVGYDYFRILAPLISTTLKLKTYESFINDIIATIKCYIFFLTFFQVILWYLVLHTWQVQILCSSLQDFLSMLFLFELALGCGCMIPGN